MKKTGEILKKAREEKGLSLHEIGLSLKISSKVLKAIEEGDDNQLPAKTFLRGFVQSYANFLHLDSNQVLEVFYEEMGSTRPKPYIRTNENERPPSKEDLAAEAPAETPLKAQVRGTGAPEDKKPDAEAVVTPIKKKPSTSDRDNLHALRETKSTRTIIITIVGVLLVGLIIFTKKMIDKYSKEAEVPSNEVAQTMEGATPVNEENAPAGEQPTEVPEEGSITAQAPAPMTPMSTQQATPAPASSQTTPTPQPSPVASATPKPSPTAAPSATPAATPAASPSPSATANPSPSPTASPTPKQEGNKPVELIVEALDTVEIEYASPSGKPQKIKLTAEQVHTFKSRSGLKINFSNGGAVNLILNGKDIGIPGDLGQPIKLSY